MKRLLIAELATHRQAIKALELLSLPAEILQIIMSFLTTLSLAAVRETCRALRDAATPDREHVTFAFKDWYIAKARASPDVLLSLHKYQSLLDRLAREHQSRGVSASANENIGYEYTRRWLQMQQLASVAPEIVLFEVMAAWAGMAPEAGELSHRPHVLLSQMQLLTSLRLEAPLDRVLVQQLSDLRHLKSLEALDPSDNVVIEEMCGTLASPLSRLSLECLHRRQEEIDPPADDDESSDARLKLEMLAGGGTSGLQELHVSLPSVAVRHCGVLTALTALSALDVRLLPLGADLSGLGRLTGLRSLRVIGDMSFTHVAEDVAPLAALTGLTLLEMTVGEQRRKTWPFLEHCSEISALSHLTALRVLRYTSFHKAVTVPGDPLPVQFRFLNTATALQELCLSFSDFFWNLNDASRQAMQQALARLSSLRVVKLGVGLIYEAVMEYSPQMYRPLSVFAAAPSLEELYWECNLPKPYRCDEPDARAPEARGCLRALTQLRSLSLVNPPLWGPDAPHIGDYLEGLPSTQLTSLHLSGVAATVPLMQQISGYRNLHRLILEARSVSVNFLDPLFDMDSLRELLLCVDSCREEHGEAASEIRARALQLEAAIAESAYRLGERAHVEMVISTS